MALAGYASAVTLGVSAGNAKPIALSSDELAGQDIPANVSSLSLSDRDCAILVVADPQGLDRAHKGSWWFTSNGGNRAWRILPQTVMTPEMFGSIADNSGDAVPVIASAIAFVAANRVTTLRFRNGRTYRLASWIRGTDASWDSYRASIALPAGLQGVTLDLNGATLFQACDAMTFGAAYRFFNDPVMRSHILPVEALPHRGEQRITLRAPATLRPGAMAMLISRNTTGNDYAPIAEMLQVKFISGRSIEFETPVRKDHEAAMDDPVGLLDISDHHIRDCRIVGPGCVVNHHRRAGTILQAFGFTMSHLEVVGRGGFNVRGRGLVINQCRAKIQADWSKPLYRPYAIALDTGTSEATIKGFQADGGTNVAFVHLHEALTDVVVRDLHIVNGTEAMLGAEYVGAISILSISQNVLIERARIVNNPEGPAIEARYFTGSERGNAGLVLRDIEIAGVFAGSALVVNDANVATLDGIDLTKARLSRGKKLLSLQGTAHRAIRVLMRRD